MSESRPNSFLSIVAILFSGLALLIVGLNSVPKLLSPPGDPAPEVAVAPAAKVPIAASPAVLSPAKQKPRFAPRVELPVIEAPATKEQLEAEATFVAEQLLASLPGEPMAMHVSAILNAQLHNTQRAEELWQKCIEADPTAEPYYVNLAAIALDRGESESAVATLKSAVERGLRTPDVYHHLGVALLNVGKAEEAAEISQAVVEQLPNSAAHWLVLGQAQLKLGDSKAAEVSLRKAVALGSRSKPSYFALMNACLRNKNREAAMEFREKYLSFTSDDGVAADERYQVLSEAEARRVCSTVLGESAAMYSAAGAHRDAEMLYLRLLALTPKNFGTCQRLAELYAQLERPEDELVVRRRMAEADPFNLLNYLLIARLADGMGRAEEAEASIKLAIALAPQTVTGYSAMTDFLLSNGQPKRAQWFVEHALKLKPSRQGFLLLAKTLRAQGQGLQATAAEAKAAKLSTKQREIEP